MNIVEYEKIITEIKAQIGDVNLMAVSKTRTIEEINAVYAAGIRLFGENHVQEIVQKFSAQKPSDMKVHLIGHLQTNKVSKVVPLVDMIESVDSLRLLEHIDLACEKIGKTMPVLLEMNTSGESAKSGFTTEEELLDCVENAKKLNNVKICGLMTVGPVDCPPEKKDALTRDAFARLKVLFEKCKNLYGGFEVLSMGMSGDYLIGVEEGATEVRIGTLIFGARNYA